MEEPAPPAPPANRFGVRFFLALLGGLLMLVSPLVGAIPGPGGVIVFAAGLALALKNSLWAKRVYARLKRRHPRKGAWADWAMRRRSALRRHQRAKADPQALDIGASPRDREAGDPARSEPDRR